MLNRLFLAFSNSKEQPLESLLEEDDQVYKMLSRLEVNGHFRIHRDSFTTIQKIAEYLILFQKEIKLFLFSGHADKDSLLLNDQVAKSSGIVQTLGRCSKLHVVILNGCSTNGQVATLLNEGIPVIIATSAQVNDKAASQFSISFFQALSDHHKSIGEAFEDAIGPAKTLYSGDFEIEKCDRGIFSRRRGTSDEKRWGIYYQNKSDLDWKLPMGAPDVPTDYKPNERLIEKLINDLAPFDLEINKIKEKELTEFGETLGEGGKKKAILNCLPHPISHQLRKLLAKEIGYENSVFYDKPGIDRLRQIGCAYSTMIRLFNFILIAEFWQELERNKNLKVTPECFTSMESFIVQKESFNSLDSIRTIWRFLKDSGYAFFINEINSDNFIFNLGTDFAVACQFLEIICQKLDMGNRDIIEEAPQLCPTAEEKLAIVFAGLGFLARYSLSSIRHIQVLKYRFPSTPSFSHKLIRLNQDFMGIGLEEGQEIMNKFMDTASVILHQKEGGLDRFLNLSPFVIDESAFDEKADLATLYFFDYHEKNLDALCYRYIYKPSDPKLMIKGQKHFRNLKIQFDAFSKLLQQLD